MKKLLLFIAFLAVSASVFAQKGKVGTSVSLVGQITPETMAEIKAAGIDYIEVTMNNFVRKQPENEVYIKAYQALKDIREAGLKVWSVHLPYSSTWDVSMIDPKKREAAVVFFEEMIRLAGIFEPQRLVLHPGADNIKNANTRADRLRCARNSIGRLALTAKEIGAVLCVENLPRTCPGRTADEIDYLTAGIPNVMICFDTNHLLIDTHDEFFRKVGDRIGTIHVSDYDRVDEKHWLPLSGRGTVDWPSFYRNLKACGYKGVFMFESRGDGVTAEDVVRVYNQMKTLR